MMLRLQPLYASTLLLLLLPVVSCFTPLPTVLRPHQIRLNDDADDTIRVNNNMMIPPGVASIMAGSVAGAVGIGVAFPLDTLKTKAQVLGQGGGDLVGIPNNPNMFQMISLIWDQEGVAGFFGGVRGMMAGQAAIKAVAFCTNAVVLDYLHESHFLNLGVTPQLLLAACSSGFVTSFIVAPIERIKVMMQAQPEYTNEFQCARDVLDGEGWVGLMGRGLGPTLAREIPGYGIYFWSYGILMQQEVVRSMLGPAAPLVFGALAGMACWIPVYPVDVVKTLVQNTKGGEEAASSWQVCQDLYAQGGVGAFWDGLTPKMLRAAINHSVTFYTYDLVVSKILSS